MNTALKVILTIIVAALVISSSYFIYTEYVEDKSNDDENNPPNETISLSPIDNAIDISINADISWSGGDPDQNDTVTYDVYFGTSSSPPKVANNQTSTTYNPLTLDYETKYYWKIVAKDKKGESTESSVFSFTTKEEPSNSEDNESPSKVTGLTVSDAKDGKLDLSWNTATDNVDVYYYKIYRDGSYIDDEYGTSYQDTGLNNDQSYSYEISAVDTSDNEGEKSDSKSGTPTSSNNQDQTHTVFIEEGTAGWCSNCPDVAEILHELYESEDYNFYYVSLVDDESVNAQQRLDEYNINAFPTVYIDGGYEIVIGAESKSVFEEKISAASSREIPDLSIDLITEYDDTNEEFETTIIIKNNENEVYDGTLRAYITEKISRWNDYNGISYSFGFVEYLIDEDISISAGDSLTKIKTESISDLDPDNLMIIAVVFSSESVEKDSYPDDPHPFDAYFADATAATEVVEGGNLPPKVGINNPKKLRIHLFGNPRRMSPFYKNTILIGKTNVTAYASDDSSIEKVEFYIDDELKKTVEKAPYEYEFRKVKHLKRLIRRHTITVKAYDDEGKTSEASIDVLTFFL